MRYRIQGTLELFVEMLNEQDAIHDSAFARKGIVSLRQTTYYDLHRQYGLNRRMPVWGPILGTLDHSSENRSLQTLRVSNLADYIQSLQAK